jgi:hypothetical protein
MTTGPGQAALERRYRRMLRWYPQAFRRESGEEILSVLLDCARPGQRRPRLAERADLIVSAIGLRMGPGRRRPPWAVTAAMWLMRAGAAAEIAGLIFGLLTIGGVEHAIAHQHAGLLPGALPDVLLVTAIAVPVPCGLWLWLAWANGRGHRWARWAFTAVFCAYTVIVAAKLAAGTASYAPADLMAVTVQWLIGLAALLLIFSGGARRHYRREPLHAARSG